MPIAAKRTLTTEIEDLLILHQLTAVTETLVRKMEVRPDMLSVEIQPGGWAGKSLRMLGMLVHGSRTEELTGGTNSELARAKLLQIWWEEPQQKSSELASP